MESIVAIFNAINAIYECCIASHNLRFLLLLGITAVPRENENNAYANLWGQTRCILADLQVAKVWWPTIWPTISDCSTLAKKRIETHQWHLRVFMAGWQTTNNIAIMTNQVITRVLYHKLTWCNSVRLWKWLPHRLLKCQSLTITVLFWTTITWTIMLTYEMIPGFEPFTKWEMFYSLCTWLFCTCRHTSNQ